MAHKTQDENKQNMEKHYPTQKNQKRTKTEHTKKKKNGVNQYAREE